MKVRVTITVDVDKASWALAYDTEETAAAVREDVKTYIANGVSTSAPDAPIQLIDWS